MIQTSAKCTWASVEPECNKVIFMARKSLLSSKDHFVSLRLLTMFLFQGLGQLRSKSIVRVHFWKQVQLTKQVAVDKHVMFGIFKCQMSLLNSLVKTFKWLLRLAVNNFQLSLLFHRGRFPTFFAVIAQTSCFLV